MWCSSIDSAWAARRNAPSRFTSASVLGVDTCRAMRARRRSAAAEPVARCRVSESGARPAANSCVASAMSQEEPSETPSRAAITRIGKRNANRVTALPSAGAQSGAANVRTCLRAARSTVGRGRLSNARSTAFLRARWRSPSLIRTSEPNTSPATDPRSGLGTGSDTGRTRQRGLARTAATVSALDATQRCNRSSKYSGRSATSSE